MVADGEYSDHAHNRWLKMLMASGGQHTSGAPSRVRPGAAGADASSAGDRKPGRAWGHIAGPSGSLLLTGSCGDTRNGNLHQLLAFRRPDLAAGLVLVDPGHEELESLLPLPVQWGWRIMLTVFPDELHGDAPVTMAALREMPGAATPLPHLPVVVLSAARR